VFTHTSWASERGASYERLEFLGDSVLELAVAHALYDRHPDFSEGKLAKVRSHVVSRWCPPAGRHRDLPTAEANWEATPRGRRDDSRSSSVMAEVTRPIDASTSSWRQRGRAGRREAFAERVAYAVDKPSPQDCPPGGPCRQGASVTYELVETTGPDHDRAAPTAALVEAGSAGDRGEQEASEQQRQRGAARNGRRHAGVERRPAGDAPEDVEDARVLPTALSSR
jgi:ribonuclease-3